ncbi:hypothetical protein FOC4_g10012087 [Fusarium odoratissimum]|uniref:Uncharacterized protein n=1 Tax=Fusarium oxysporum f. sp. cubense (strain race 4) TaxID=2502994 RepID=N1R7K9_FUSC4|nr:hypothetical protein FOC4_g10012087 [Fusarium odoratissimum]
MCIIFLTPVDCTSPKKITEKAKESFWPQLASDIERNNVKLRDLAPEGGICRGDVTVLPFDHKLQNDMDFIPPTLNNGGIIADHCDECATNNTVDELTDNLHNLLPEESKGRYAVSLSYGGETFPLLWMRNCPEMRVPAAFRTFVAQYQRRLDKYESSTKLWNNCCYTGAPVKVRDLGSQ